VPILGGSPPRVITFDFYGTLVQWHEGLHEVFGSLVRRKVASSEKTAALAHKFHVIGRSLRDAPPFTSYRTILKESLKRALAENEMSFAENDFVELIAKIENLPPHPEVPAVLKKLKSKYRLALISNSDDDLIMKSVPNLTVPLDGVITAQQAKAYKPNPQLFRTAHEKLGVDPSEVIHVAASMPLDMPVCKELGIRAIWVNRRDETGTEAFRPFVEVKNVEEALIHLVD
jgi:2-haloacid dehalogenase